MTLGELIVATLAVAVLSNAIGFVSENPGASKGLLGGARGILHHLIDPSVPLIPEPPAFNRQTWQQEAPLREGCKSRCQAQAPLYSGAYIKCLNECFAKRGAP